MRRELFQPTIEGEARILILIDGFSSRTKSLEGRTKLSKLDFFLRYPAYLKRALDIRDSGQELDIEPAERDSIETKMVRYRYGPWDPAYYALLGRLIGKNLVVPVPGTRGIGYKITDSGHQLAQSIGGTAEWSQVQKRVKLLKRHLDISGTNLKNFVYQHFPEVTRASWGESL